MILFIHIFSTIAHSLALGTPGEVFAYGIEGTEYNPAGIYELKNPSLGINVADFKTVNWIGGAMWAEGYTLGASLKRTPTMKAGKINLATNLWNIDIGIGCGLEIEIQAKSLLSVGLLYNKIVGGYIGVKREIRTERTYYFLKAAYTYTTEEGLNLLFGGKLSRDTIKIDLGAKYEIIPEIDLFLRIGSKDAGGGFEIMFPEDIFKFSVGYNYAAKERNWNFGISYTRIWKEIKEKVEIREVVKVERIPVPIKEKQEVKRPRIRIIKKASPEIEKRQRELLKEGGQLYAEEKYREALVKWEEVIRLFPENELADQARENIKYTKKILKKIEK